MLNFGTDACLTKCGPKEAQTYHSQNATRVQERELTHVEGEVGEHESQPSDLNVIAEHSSSPQGCQETEQDT